jgi:RecA-family ATPase
LRIIDYDQFIDLPRPNVDWIVEDLIPRPGLIELMGPPKAGKSFLALDLAIKVARGEDFMGHKSRKSRVLYFQLDTSEKIMRDRGIKLRAAGYDTTAALLGMVHPADAVRPVNIMMAQGQQYFRQAVSMFRPELVIMDTLRECHQEDENESTAMKSVMDMIESIFVGLSLLLVHHTHKLPPEIDKPDPINASRGSSYITGKVDAFWLLYHQRLSVWSRWGDPSEYKALQKASGMFDLQPFVSPVPRHIPRQPVLYTPPVQPSCNIDSLHP